MPGRTIVKGSTYRFGFNGKENDKETTSTATYDYGFRIYNPALGKFLSVDPLTKNYPMLTPYQYASNRPLDGVDLDGLEWKKVESYDPKTGVTNVHFQVQLKVINDSKVFRDLLNLKKEIEDQFKNAFDGRVSGDEKTTYSASIVVEFSADISVNGFEVVLDDFRKGPMKGASPAPNTQVNGFGVPAGEWVSDPSLSVPRQAKHIAQDIVHELLHTGNVTHPDDPSNKASDVDLEPDVFQDINGRKALVSYKLGPKAKFDEVIQNVMLYNFKVVNGKQVKEHQPDKFKRGKASPDQAEIISQQIDNDTKRSNGNE
jgi:RHS repeat-associated protein